MAVVFSIVLGLAFGAGGGFVFYLAGYRPWSDYLAARSWVATPCTVLSCRIEESSGEDSRSYRIDVRYRYQVGGRSFEGGRHDLVNAFSNLRSQVEGKAGALRAGTQTVCYVDARRPEVSVLDRGLTLFHWLLLVPLAFAVVGLAIAVAAPLAGIWLLRSSAAAARRATQPVPSLPAQVAPRAGPLGLRQISGGGIAMVAMAVVWNGLLLVMAAPLLLFRDQPFAPLLGLVGCFYLPFLLVGVGLAAAAGFVWLGALNPRPVVTLLSQDLVPGGSAAVAWRLEGRSGRLSRLNIRLEGVEQATYTVGTDTSTDSNVFFTADLLDTDAGDALAGGTLWVRIPDRTLPSFESKHNKVLWRLVVSGVIRHWPDLRAEFPIEVRPGGAPA